MGTGPAGAAAAWSLCRVGVEPLVLEAGPASSDLGLTARLRGVTLLKRRPALRTRSDLVASRDPSAVLYEALAPGGLSNHWSCAVPRFSPEDFEDAKRAGHAYTWPIDYAQLEPWYRDVEALLRIAGSARDVAHLPAGVVATSNELGADWQSVTRSAAQSGRDVVAMPYAYGASSTLTRSATAFNAFCRLIQPLEAAGRLRIRYGSPVLRLEWSRADDRVVAVICRANDGTETRVPCRAVVLAAGAVGSAQILLDSRGPEWPRGVGNEQGLVGRYLHDHPLAKLVVRVSRPLSVSPASYVTRPPLTSSEPLYAAAFMQWGDVKTRAKTLLSMQPGKSHTLGFSVFGTMVPSLEDGIATLAEPATN
ncbi:MAG TPA: GMC family oxidoreductase N-terminal domain-containing protein, partial [Polyangiaceae bacterium]|nr:GMC family oxidoreductase N-terminal domain-containing protein [Polyangiaceae bacterium]